MTVAFWLADSGFPLQVRVVRFSSSATLFFRAVNSDALALSPTAIRESNIGEGLYEEPGREPARDERAQRGC